MSKTDRVFAAIAVIALVLSCISISNSLSFSAKQDIRTRLEILNRWVDDELEKVRWDSEFDTLEYFYLLEITRIGRDAAELLGEHDYAEADNLLRQTSYLIDDYTELRYGD